MSDPRYAIADEDLCAAIERELEYSHDDVIRPSDVAYLFGGNPPRTAARLRRLQNAGLARREHRWSPWWTLTDAGYALAQQGEVLCHECTSAPGVREGLDRKLRCTDCAAERYEQLAADAEYDAGVHRRRADDCDQRAEQLRALADELRQVVLS